MTTPESPQQWVWLARIRRPQGRKGEVFADILTDFPEKFADRRRLWLIPDPDSPRPKSTQPSPSEITSLPPGAKASLAGKTGLAAQTSLVTGHDFSRAAKVNQLRGALAPEELPIEVELLHHWLHKGGIVLHFAQSKSISDAKTLASQIVAIPLAERTPLNDDEFYIADLIGCTLFDVATPTPARVGRIEEVDRTAGPVALLVVLPAGSQEEILIPFAKGYLRRIDVTAKRVEMALPEGLVDLNSTAKL